MISDLVRMYKKGAITASHLAVQCLHMLDPAEPDLVLAPLPREILTAIEDFAESYKPDDMVTNYGVIPAPDQVAVAMEWIRKRDQYVSSSEQQFR